MCERLRNELWFRSKRRFQAKDCYVPNLRDLNRGASTERAGLIDELIGELITDTYDPDSKRSPYSTDAFLLAFAGGVYPRENITCRGFGKIPRTLNLWGIMTLADAAREEALR